MDPRTELWRLRRDVLRHPVRRAAVGRSGQATLLAHRAYSHWASGRLAESLRLAHPYRHLGAVVDQLNDAGAGREFAEFLRAVEHGRGPVAALADAGGPLAAGPLLEGTDSIALHGPEAARLGAFGLGLPCCSGHEAAVLGRLATAAALSTGAPGAIGDDDSAAAALLVLTAQVVLYDGALAAIRARKRAQHPSTGGRANLHLLPAG